MSVPPLPAPNGARAHSPFCSPHDRLSRPGAPWASNGGPPFDAGLAAIAVPLRDKTRVHGSINILWIKTAFTIEGFAARHLADLKAAAAEIVDTLPGPTKQSLMRVSSRLP